MKNPHVNEIWLTKKTFSFGRALIQIRKIDETRCSCNADVLDVEFPKDFEQIILSRINAPEYYWNFYFKHLDRRIE